MRKKGNKYFVLNVNPDSIDIDCTDTSCNTLEEALQLVEDGVGHFYKIYKTWEDAQDKWQKWGK